MQASFSLRELVRALLLVFFRVCHLDYPPLLWAHLFVERLLLLRYPGCRHCPNSELDFCLVVLASRAHMQRRSSEIAILELVYCVDPRALFCDAVQMQ